MPSADRRITRTQQALSDALFGLLVRKPWHKITVQNLIDEANVGRSTFYAHYDTKLDLLLAQLPLLELTLPPAGHTGVPDLVPLFEHVHERAAAMKPILAQPIRGEITDHIERNLARDWQQILAANHPDHATAVTSVFLAGATLATMRHYLSAVNDVAPADAAAQLQQLISSTLGINDAVA